MSGSLSAAVKLHKALAHATRVRILAMLRGGERCVCQLNAVIGLAPSTMSAHLGELKDAGLIAERKAGRWVHYRLARGERVEATLAALWQAVGGDPQLEEDRRILAQVVVQPVERICRPDFDLAALRQGCCPADETEKRR